MAKPSTKNSTVSPSEIAKFQAMAEEWWNPDGKFRPLHQFNPVRLAYIRDVACAHFGLNHDSFSPLEGLSVLDVGCGGGLLCEPMTRMGAKVTGLDAGEKNIRIARLHAQQEGLEIEYICGAVEELAEQRAESREQRAKGSFYNAPSPHLLPEEEEDMLKNRSPLSALRSLSPDSRLPTPDSPFDLILNMEVIEHVDNVPEFIEASAALLKPGGLMFVATLNRTLKSLALAKIGAEYILRWLPRGTHDWQKFLKPSEIERLCSAHGLSLHTQTGMSFSPLSRDWRKSDDLAVNYVMVFGKGVPFTEY